MRTEPEIDLEADREDRANPGKGAEARTSSAGRTPGVWQLAWPTITGNLLMSLTGIVDLKIVGSLGASGIAAVGAGNRIFFTAQAILIGITAGTTALVARAWGARNVREAEQLTQASLLLCLISGGAFTALGVVFADSVTGLFQIGDEASLLASQYIRTLSMFCTLFAIGVALSTALRAVGDMVTPLWVGAVTNVVNVVLDYGLVYGELGLPRMGIPGAALATGLAFTASSTVLLLLWWRRLLQIGPGGRGSLTRQRALRLLQIGYPAAIEQGFWQGGFVGFLVIVALYGTEPFAAYNIGVQILSFSFVIGFAFSIAGATLAGQHLGAGDPDGARRSGWRSMRMSIGSMLLFGAIIVAASEPLAKSLIDDPVVVRLTVSFILVLGLVQPLMAIEFALGGALRGAGDTRFPLFTTFTGLIAVRIGGAVVLARLGARVEWVFAVLIADYLIKSILLTLRFRSNAWIEAIPATARSRSA